MDWQTDPTVPAKMLALKASAEEIFGCTCHLVRQWKSNPQRFELDFSEQPDAQNEPSAKGYGHWLTS